MNTIEDFIRRSVDAIASDEELSRDIDHTAGRLAELRSKIGGKKPMKYALESLPELIGADDYADLCEVLGMVEWHREDIPTGADFARRVRDRVFKLKHDRQMADASRRAGALL